MNPLPGLHLTWDQPVLGTLEFAEYNVYRRVATGIDVFGRSAVAGPWVRIARIEDIETTEYTDYGAGSGIAYEYSVTWWSTDGIESGTPVPPGSGSVAWYTAHLHDAQDPEIRTEVRATDVTAEQTQDRTAVSVRGRRAGVSFVGERFERIFELSTVPDAPDEREVWERARIMLDRQYSEGSIYCLRLGHTGEVVFGDLEPARRSDTPSTSSTTLRFVERGYEEAPR